MFSNIISTEKKFVCTNEGSLKVKKKLLVKKIYSSILWVCPSAFGFISCSSYQGWVPTTSFLDSCESQHSFQPCQFHLFAVVLQRYPLPCHSSNQNDGLLLRSGLCPETTRYWQYSWIVAFCVQLVGTKVKSSVKYPVPETPSKPPNPRGDRSVASGCQWKRPQNKSFDTWYNLIKHKTPKSKSLKRNQAATEHSSFSKAAFLNGWVVTTKWVTKLQNGANVFILCNKCGCLQLNKGKKPTNNPETPPVENRWCCTYQH